MQKNKKVTFPIYKTLWCKIRYWQSLRDISNDMLASYLNVSKRTLNDYDKTACNITLGQLDSFLNKNNIELSDLLEMK